MSLSNAGGFVMQVALFFSVKAIAVLFFPMATVTETEESDKYARMYRVNATLVVS